MFEIKGNLWTLPADAICITTNGTIKKDGTCVMGRGCAKEAKDKFPGIDKVLGDSIKKYGNNVIYLSDIEDRGDNKRIYSFPVKHNWYEKADLELIEQSCIQLVKEIDSTIGDFDFGFNIRFIAVPRPGCGNGQLEWKDVKPICEKYFDDRFGVVTF